MKPSPNGAWIFVSHSHRDLEKVREIRNELERRGCNPLLFFLKCLDADKALLPKLIRDEINALTTGPFEERIEALIRSRKTREME